MGCKRSSIFLPLKLGLFGFVLGLFCHFANLFWTADSNGGWHNHRRQAVLNLLIAFARL